MLRGFTPICLSHWGTSNEGQAFGRLVMSGYFTLWVALKKRVHIISQRIFLYRGSGVGGLSTDTNSTSVNYMPCYLIEPLSSIGHFPRINHGVLVVLHQALYSAIEVYQVGVTYPVPTPASRRGRQVPAPDVGCRHFEPAWRGGAVYHEQLQCGHLAG